MEQEELIIEKQKKKKNPAVIYICICFNLPPNMFESWSNSSWEVSTRLAPLVAFAPKQPDTTSSWAQMGLLEPGAKHPASVRLLLRWE